MGDRVEILTTKNARPSLDWLTPSLEFLYTARARTKVSHWFKIQNKTENIARGTALLNQTMQLTNQNIDINPAVTKLNFKNSKDLLAALGVGSLKLRTILSSLNITLKPLAPKKQTIKPQHSLNIHIDGINNLLVRIANCCNPKSDTAIVGYITKSQGVSIHRADCRNILRSKKIYPARCITAAWRND